MLERLAKWYLTRLGYIIPSRGAYVSFSTEFVPDGWTKYEGKGNEPRVITGTVPTPSAVMKKTPPIIT